MKSSVTALVLTMGSALVLPSAARAQNDSPAREDTAPVVQVVVVRAVNACFSAAIRVTGFLVAQKDAVVTLMPNDRVIEVMGTEGDRVAADKAVARVERQMPDPARPGAMKAETVTLTAPAAGVITQANAFLGIASPMQPLPLFTIAVDGEIELEAEIPSVHAPQLSPGQTVRVQVGDLGELSGRVRLVPAEIDQKTQLGRARISLDRDPQLRLGMFARATVSADRSCGISVPNSAITYRTGGATVQVVRRNIIETRSIQVGIHSDTDTEVRKGLNEGDLIVANAGTSLHDGDAVRPVDLSTLRTGQR
jgi:hypothetical protein